MKKSEAARPLCGGRYVAQSPSGAPQRLIVGVGEATLALSN
jgi:hypothetical protein